jgi:hypothetical protein
MKVNLQFSDTLVNKRDYNMLYVQTQYNIESQEKLGYKFKNVEYNYILDDSVEGGGIHKITIEYDKPHD